MIVKSLFILASAIVTSFLLNHLLYVCPVSFAAATPVPTTAFDQTLDFAASSMNKGKKTKNGTCDEGYEWTVIHPISDLGATCCPMGYKGESAIIFSDLSGTFCCPSTVDEVPCDTHSREMPRPPVTCPKGDKLVGVTCQTDNNALEWS